MKNLILIRHAKSSWKDAGLDDHDRPLNKRGLRDSPFMSKILKKKKVKPDLIASSTAKRAIATAKEFCRNLHYPVEKIDASRALYLADVNDLVQYCRQFSDEYKTVMLFGHNPGITEFANFLSGTSIDNMPTCSISSFSLMVESWSQLDIRKGELLYFEYPKMYFKDSEE